VWGLVAAVAMPLLASYLRRALVLLMRRHKTLLRSRPAVHLRFSGLLSPCIRHFTPQRKLSKFDFLCRLSWRIIANALTDTGSPEGRVAQIQSFERAKLPRNGPRILLRHSGTSRARMTQRRLQIQVDPEVSFVQRDGS
jgi:hypothetical protein